ncbi:MAG: tryptophan synthase subunit alpha [Spirochaetia bacterium]|nr:tryptophan synthase subunit alpha [Spirochaetota bacterium]MCX8096031.1 tryptophan synthase subunit alpha [Spirochaetota bacterium]MDW8111826.1 tryptophan synthase subunit alpha [Spirochaetia bacterium]
MDSLERWISNTKPTIVYLTVGYPSFEESVEIARFIVKNKFAQMIEAGIPFSDPIADGEVIQFSTQKALENGININHIVKFISILKSEFNIPVFAMGYYNPIYANLEANLQKLSSVGTDGLIIPDINVEEVIRINPLLKKYNLKIVGFVAPNTSRDRIKKIVSNSSGFIYLVSSYGTTGIRERLDLKLLEEVVKNIKSFKNIPVAIGFGIRDMKTAREVKNFCDGAIIGSAIIKIVEENPKNYIDKIEEFFGS